MDTGMLLKELMNANMNAEEIPEVTFRKNDFEKRRSLRASEAPRRLLDRKVELFHRRTDYADHIRKCHHKMACEKSREHRDSECQDQALVHNKADYNSRNDGRGKEDGL